MIFVHSTELLYHFSGAQLEAISAFTYLNSHSLDECNKHITMNIGELNILMPAINLAKHLFYQPLEEHQLDYIQQQAQEFHEDGEEIGFDENVYVAGVCLLHMIVNGLESCVESNEDYEKLESIKKMIFR